MKKNKLKIKKNLLNINLFDIDNFYKKRLNKLFKNKNILTINENDLYFIFNVFDYLYLNREEINKYLEDKYEEFSIINIKEQSFYILKNDNQIIIIRYNKNELYSSLKIIEENELKSYVLMNEKLMFLIEELEIKKNEILNFNEELLLI